MVRTKKLERKMLLSPRHWWQVIFSIFSVFQNMHFRIQIIITLKSFAIRLFEKLSIWQPNGRRDPNHLVDVKEDEDDMVQSKSSLAGHKGQLGSQLGLVHVHRLDAFAVDFHGVFVLMTKRQK